MTVLATSGELEQTGWRQALEGNDPATLRQAREVVEQLLRAHPEDFAFLDVEVQLLHALGEDELAESLLEEYLHFDNRCVDATARLAWMWWQTGRRDEAIAELNAALSRAPGATALRVRLAEWLVEAGQFSKAQSLAEEGLRTTGESAPLWRALAQAQAAQGSFGAAIRSFRRAHELVPDDIATVHELARLLHGDHQSREALALIEAYATREEFGPRLWATAARCANGAGAIEKRNWFLLRLATDPRCDKDEVQHQHLACAVECLGPEAAERSVFGIIESGQAVDSLGVEFVETIGAQSNRAKMERLFRIASGQPLRYPRTISRFLTTYHSLVTTPWLVGRWVAASMPIIWQSTPLWAAVGAWQLNRGKWQDAADHLVAWPSRPDVKPWMILLLGRALEGLGRTSEANAQYRAALQMPGDHAEMALRSRLAYNLSIEGSPGAGRLVALECSRRGRQFQTSEDRARNVCSEALFAETRTHSEHDREELFQEANTQLNEIIRTSTNGNIRLIQRLFQARWNDVVSRPRDEEKEPEKG